MSDRALADHGPAAGPAGEHHELRTCVAGMERLVGVIQDLSLARDLPAVMAVVRSAARELTRADGATFVLREGDQCHYVDEDAIAPLWKGRRFPMSACVSGWVMLNQTAAVVKDIYQDPRVPADAYRPTFVRSLAMVPIRPAEPVGAIGVYWAEPHCATPLQVRLLQALADSTSTTVENLRLYADLERRVRERTAQLEAANRELEAFSYSVSHDLRAPLRSIDGFSKVVLEKYEPLLDPQGKHYLERIRAGSQHMAELIDRMLDLAKLTRADLKESPVDLGALARAAADDLRRRSPERHVELHVGAPPPAVGDPHLLRSVLENLLGNAWKFTGRSPRPRVEFGWREVDGRPAYFVRDNGAGFDPRYADRLFAPFHRLHDASEFEGTGIGLATVSRIVRRHGGRVWAEGKPGEGATFWFTLEGP